MYISCMQHAAGNCYAPFRPLQVASTADAAMLRFKAAVIPLPVQFVKTHAFTFSIENIPPVTNHSLIEYIDICDKWIWIFSSRRSLACSQNKNCSYDPINLHYDQEFMAG